MLPLPSTHCGIDAVIDAAKKIGARIFIWNKNIHIENWSRIDQELIAEVLFSFHPFHLQWVQWLQKLHHVLDKPLIVGTGLAIWRDGSLQALGLWISSRFFSRLWIKPMQTAVLFKKQMSCLAGGTSKPAKCAVGNPCCYVSLLIPLPQDYLGVFPSTASQSMSVCPCKRFFPFLYLSHG